MIFPSRTVTGSCVAWTFPLKNESYVHKGNYFVCSAATLLYFLKECMYVVNIYSDRECTEHKYTADL